MNCYLNCPFLKTYTDRDTFCTGNLTDYYCERYIKCLFYNKYGSLERPIECTVHQDQQVNEDNLIIRQGSVVSMSNRNILFCYVDEANSSRGNFIVVDQENNTVAGPTIFNVDPV